MEGKVPSGFLDLSTASTKRNSELFGVIGIVTDVMPARATMGKDWMFTFSLSDSSVFGAGQKVRFFKPERDMPPVHEPGDIVVLYHVKTMVNYGAPIIVSGPSTRWTVFHSGSVPERVPQHGAPIRNSRSPSTPTPNQEELSYIVFLNNSRDPEKFSKPLSEEAKQSMMKPREKFSLIKDLCTNSFYDLTGLVVKLFQSGERMELYITDYTTNSFLYNYTGGDDYDDGMEYSTRMSRQWRGPLGKATLQVTLFPPHSYWVSKHIREMQYVSVRNVHIKNNRDANGLIEGVLHEDRKNENRIDVSAIDPSTDDRAKDVLRRKRDYEKSLKKGIVDPTIGPTAEKKLSKSQAKRKRAREKQEANAMPTPDTETDPDLPNSKRPTPIPEQSSRAALRAAMHAPNPHIRTAYPEHPIRSILDILETSTTHAYVTPNTQTPCTLPYQNLISRATVRVIDFQPPLLEDFARRRRVGEYEALSDCSAGEEEEEDEEESEEEVEEEEEEAEEVVEGVDGSQIVQKKKNWAWEWAFTLLVEDASPHAPLFEDGSKARMPVYVAGENADYLLKLDAQK